MTLLFVTSGTRALMDVVISDEGVSIPLIMAQLVPLDK